ncbi:hypothetical protein J7E91_32265 [Streptomyces sp. ISL-99]|uniref:hypothetical protein n=1 Tax=Streptomyces sp. ISL-99 TaxID=2819193 RepID=UPI001BE75384|nr:hypothetical protein [Streptomyces sp. ISL-99]MBT2529913.1 hypothetical protein [Streptomyces sp. ISL-99]
MAQQPRNPQGPNPDRGVWDEALEPEQVRSLNSALRKLADGGGASRELQDTAKNLLSGRLSLREALDDPSAARALGSGLASLRGQWESLSEEEREQIRLGEATPDGTGAPSEPNEPRRSEGQPSEPRKKGPARHSGGFSLY